MDPSGVTVEDLLLDRYVVSVRVERQRRTWTNGNSALFGKNWTKTTSFSFTRELVSKIMNVRQESCWDYNYTESRMSPKESTTYFSGGLPYTTDRDIYVDPT